MTGTQAVRAAVQRLNAAGVPDAARDARRLLAHVLKIAPGRLTLHIQDVLRGADMSSFDRLIARRTAREPVSHLTGARVFYGRQFRVTGDVLDPRPETETLIDVALQFSFTRVLDLGTGSGCIVLTLLSEVSGATGVGADLSAAALTVARANADGLGVTDRVDFIQSDWMKNTTGLFDLIVSNPPYIAADEMPQLSPEVRNWEPRQALTDEGDGLSAYRMIIAQAPAYLSQNGRLVVEIGPSQGVAVAEMMDRAGFADVAVLPDLDDRDRVVVGKLPNAS